MRIHFVNNGIRNTQYNLITMCGRFTLTLDPSQLQDLFGLTGMPPPVLAPRYNIAPTQPVAAIILNDSSQRELTHFQWGLIPSWSKDPSMGMINARAETIREKPAFRAALKRRRCLIPANGFYEWQKTGKEKTPMYITLKDGSPFAIAGVWEQWRSPQEDVIRSCTLITTTPNSLMETIHDRMPAILNPKDYDRWLAPGELPEMDLRHLLSPYPASNMKAVAVSRKVNSPKFDSVECIEAV
ncbi:MAG: SOS response-associated peptidase [Chloroflexota bacterium]